MPFPNKNWPFSGSSFDQSPPIFHRQELQNLVSWMKDSLSVDLNDLSFWTVRTAKEYLIQHLANSSHKELLFLCGPGRNGVEGLLFASECLSLIDESNGQNVWAFTVLEDQVVDEMWHKAKERAINLGVKVVNITHLDQVVSFFEMNPQEGILFDHVFGLGLQSSLSQFLYDLITVCQKNHWQKWAWDIPTGIDMDNGVSVGNFLKVDKTLIPGPLKWGHFLGDGPAGCGELVSLSWPISWQRLNVTYLQQNKESLKDLFPTAVTLGEVQQYLSERSNMVYKHQLGHALIVGGSPGLTGALSLASESSLVCGTGLVTAATWSESYLELAARSPRDVMLAEIPRKSDLEEQSIDSGVSEISGVLHTLERFDALCVGPGLGRSFEARDTVIGILNHYTGPVVVDADALNCLDLERDGQMLALRTGPTLVTPHLGEFSKLMNVPVSAIERNPQEYMKSFVERTHIGLVLKGPTTFMMGPYGNWAVFSAPNSALAKAGSGDILAGLLTGLVAQFWASKDSQMPISQQWQKLMNLARLSVCLHGVAGHQCQWTKGARATRTHDIIDALANSLFTLDTLQGL